MTRTNRSDNFKDSMNLETTTTNAPELYPDENEDVGPQHILRMKRAPDFFEALADTQYGYTDNDRLLHDSRPTTAYAINTLQSGYCARPDRSGPGELVRRASDFAGQCGIISAWMVPAAGEDVLNFNGARRCFVSVANICSNQHWPFDAEIDVHAPAQPAGL